jgi:hypothetical protein
MASCDEGYICEVCGQPVEEIVDSDLYLRFILGLVPFDELTRTPERHIVCNPVQAQFITCDEFELVSVEGPFDKRELDPTDVDRQEKQVTTAWKRLQEMSGSGLPVEDYPLSKV